MKRTILIILFVLFIGPMLGIFASVVRPMIDRVVGENIGREIGFIFGLSIMALSMYIFRNLIVGFMNGDRSWKNWLPALLLLLFWMFMVLGEFLFQH